MIMKSIGWNTNKLKDTPPSIRARYIVVPCPKCGAVVIAHDVIQGDEPMIPNGNCSRCHSRIIVAVDPETHEKTVRIASDN